MLKVVNLRLLYLKSRYKKLKTMHDLVNRLEQKLSLEESELKAMVIFLKQLFLITLNLI